MEHPCVCRENTCSGPISMRSSGTSLRVQGEPTHTLIHTLIEGNIPACAGRTSRSCCRAASISEHPCVCRENREPAG